MGGPGGNPLWGWTQPESGAGLVFQVRCAGFTLFVSVFVSVYVLSALQLGNEDQMVKFG